MLHHHVEGRGRPLVILHGVTLDHRHMVDILEPAFAGLDGWQRIYVDLPGHGATPPRDEIRSQDDLLTAVRDFVVGTLGTAPFALVGLSRGSYIARGLIHRMPAQVTGTALIVPGGNPSSPHPLPDPVVLAPDPVLRAELPDDELWAFDHLSVVQSPEIQARRRRVLKPAQALHDAAQEARVQAAFAFSFSAEEEAQVFDKPSLIVAGRQDAMSGYLDSIDLAQRYTRATLAVLDMAGHALAFERPDLFTALIRDWLARLDHGWPG